MRRILMLTNMYPSKKYPHYGTFVKNTEDILNSIGFSVDTIKISKHDNKIIRLFSYILFCLKYFFKAFKNYDYVYIHYISHSSIPVVMFYKLFPKKNIILNVHGNDIIADRGLDFKNRGRSVKALKICSKVIVPSSYFKEVLMKNYEVDEDKIYIFPSGGIDNTVFDNDLTKTDAKKKCKLDLNRNYIGMVSRIERDKGYDILVKAFNRLSESYQDYDLIIIGSGDEDNYLDSLIEEYNLKDRIVRVPFVTQKELANYYKAMDLFVLPTKRRSESLSLVGLEAFASGTLSVICTMYGPKEYANNKNAVTYNSDSDEDLCAAIDSALKLSNTDKKNLIENAHKQALKYDKTKMADILSKIFM